MRLLEAVRPHIILLDRKLPDASGFDLIPRIHEVEAAAQVIVITAFGDTKAAVQAMKRGASDFLRKPYDLDELILALETAARSFSREAQLTVYQERDRDRYDRDELLWRSKPMERVWDLVRKVARSDAASVLITGESGTGKELVARAIHFEGERRGAPFMELNCSAFQETLIENELFGHERGAFTGASNLKRGLVELSDGGTLFLDEVGEMPVPTQAKLLRFLESRTFKRVGGNVDISIDIRILAATNVDLQKRIEQGDFRTDLFYRLQVVSIHLPPLRDREDDVNLLATHFLRKFASELHKGFTGISDEVRDLFRRYTWPGNVRELRNLIERIVLIEDGETLLLDHLPREMVRSLEDGAKRSIPGNGHLEGADLRPLREVEDEHILKVLAHCEGNKSRTARVLGLSRQGLLDRLKRLSVSSVSPS
jgi:two-component system response regulator AtoC